MNYNYSNPTVDVYFETKGKRRVSFTAWDKAYFIGSAARRLDFTKELTLPILTSIETKVLLGTANTINVGLKLPKSLFEYIVEDALDLFQIGSMIFVSYGYGNMRTREFSAVVGFPTVTFDDASVVSMSMEGSGALWFASRIETDLAKKGVRTDGWTCLEILTQICESHRCEIYTLNSAGDEVPLLGGVVPNGYENLSSKISYQPTVGKDFQLLKNVIIQTANYNYYMSGNRLVVFNPKVTSGARAIPTFEYGGRGFVENGIYPIQSASIENSGEAFPMAARKIKSSDIDPASKKKSTIEVSNGDPDINQPHNKRFGLSETKNALGDEIASEKGHTVSMAADDPRRKQRLVSEKQESLELAGLQITLEVLGMPELTPGQVIRVLGLTRLYNGSYYLKEVTHRFDGSGYKTTLGGFTAGVGESANALLSEYQGTGVPADTGVVLPPQADRMTATPQE